MSRLKSIVMKLLDIIELYIPMVLFSAVFIMYIIMIVYRYVLNMAVFEINELCQVLYLSSAMLAASYSGRTDGHVIFPLLYDKVRPKAKRIFRMISNVVVAILCGFLWYPSLDSLIWMIRKKTEVLHISFGWIYLIFLIFITLSTVYSVTNFIKDLRTPVSNEPDPDEAAKKEMDAAEHIERGDIAALHEDAVQ